MAQTEVTQEQFQIQCLLEEVADMARAHAAAITNLKVKHALELQQVAQLNKSNEKPTPITKKTVAKKTAATSKGNSNDQ